MYIKFNVSDHTGTSYIRNYHLRQKSHLVSALNPLSIFAEPRFVPYRAKTQHSACSANLAVFCPSHSFFLIVQAATSQVQLIHELLLLQEYLQILASPLFTQNKIHTINSPIHVYVRRQTEPSTGKRPPDNTLTPVSDLP